MRGEKFFLPKYADTEIFVQVCRNDTRYVCFHALPRIQSAYNFLFRFIGNSLYFIACTL